MQYWYFHGFASGPKSQKAVFFQQQLAALGLELHLPDLNLDDFSRISLSRHLAYVEQQLAGSEEPVTLIGSSLGGLLSALYAERDPRVEKMILLAPAFKFARYWQARLGPEVIAQWQRQGTYEVFHYSQGRNRLLEYGFLEDALSYEDAEFTRSVPTLIVHGRTDDVIDYRVSVDYAQSRPWVDLKLLDSDHALTDCLAEIWAYSRSFLELA
ncbi:YqiA/YcfP family alpha/beta fold hydrolase [Leptolyngbya sp. FACHB-261]|uniref:YqiA/YcfP family alpha/beta fold hydrolase n=1 Tax=Leptolyngbya sp. FACHB-261 TaxID=2692806 RepID=UPI0016861A3B|nr:YqiA/YcfP family alpha/beta fold hydrolase [Leptolyngbya sp. FACHB-261]MBD2103194.1 alpha/beta fold hydrolase [Leptolyngbya sp. FACHB-261]